MGSMATDGRSTNSMPSDACRAWHAGGARTSCRDRGEASAAAAEIGYPVVLKAVADAIPHKTELGLVVLGIGRR